MIEKKFDPKSIENNCDELPIMVVEEQSEQAPEFTELTDFASAGAGGKVMFATDDFFAPCENMIQDSEPVFIEDKYTKFGKWMDGWETRRKRTPGHDFCILKLATKCIIKGFLLNTAFFIGNYTPKYSIQAACLTPAEEKLFPKRYSVMGSAATDRQLKYINQLNSDKWEEIVPMTPLRPGRNETRLNFQKVVSDEAWTHIRVNMFPDGGIARLRAYGEARPDPPAEDKIIDLASILYGGACQGYSDAHFGHPRNMLKPNKSESMADGWETARCLRRPEIVETNEDGTMKTSCKEWAVLNLGFPGRVQKICVDTTHFKGNYPDTVRIEGVYVGCKKWDPNMCYEWNTILEPSKLAGNKENWFECASSGVISHIRVTMAPDGGISRLRVMGQVLNTM